MYDYSCATGIHVEGRRHCISILAWSSSNKKCFGGWHLQFLHDHFSSMAMTILGEKNAFITLAEVWELVLW